MPRPKSVWIQVANVDQHVLHLLHSSAAGTLPKQLFWQDLASEHRMGRVAATAMLVPLVAVTSLAVMGPPAAVAVPASVLGLGRWLRRIRRTPGFCSTENLSINLGIHAELTIDCLHIDRHLSLNGAALMRTLASTWNQVDFDRVVVLQCGEYRPEELCSLLGGVTILGEAKWVPKRPCTVAGRCDQLEALLLLLRELVKLSLAHVIVVPDQVPAVAHNRSHARHIALDAGMNHWCLWSVLGLGLGLGSWSRRRFGHHERHRLGVRGGDQLKVNLLGFRELLERLVAQVKVVTDAMPAVANNGKHPSDIACHPKMHCGHLRRLSNSGGRGCSGSADSVSIHNGIVDGSRDLGDLGSRFRFGPGRRGSLVDLIPSIRAVRRDVIGRYFGHPPLHSTGLNRSIDWGGALGGVHLQRTGA
mmetsp:Transcript_13780/g.35403  ORF Transcript_13780/g.35403 Transcript_13780/m.35403 type:complete len:417 (-) Transcript_13780:362-1612(-)